MKYELDEDDLTSLGICFGKSPEELKEIITIINDSEPSPECSLHGELEYHIYETPKPRRFL